MGAANTVVGVHSLVGTAHSTRPCCQSAAWLVRRVSWVIFELIPDFVPDHRSKKKNTGDRRIMLGFVLFPRNADLTSG